MLTCWLGRGGQHILRCIEPSCRSFEFPGEIRPQRWVPAVLVEIPADASTRRPEQVRKAVDRCAEICAHIPLAPVIRQRHPGLTSYELRGRVVDDVEARGEDHDVDLSFGTRGSDDRMTAKLACGLRDEFAVRRRQRGIEAVRQEDPLTPQGEPGPKLSSQLAVLNLACQMQPR